MDGSGGMWKIAAHSHEAKPPAGAAHGYIRDWRDEAGATDQVSKDGRTPHTHTTTRLVGFESYAGLLSKH